MDHEEKPQSQEGTPEAATTWPLLDDSFKVGIPFGKPQEEATITPAPSVTPTDIEAAYTLKGFNKNPPNIGSGKNLQSISQIGQIGQIGRDFPPISASNDNAPTPISIGDKITDPQTDIIDSIPQTHSVGPSPLELPITPDYERYATKLLLKQSTEFNATQGSTIENPILRPRTTEERLREIMARQSTSLSLDAAAMKNSYLGMDQGSEGFIEPPVIPTTPIPQVSYETYKYTIWFLAGIIFSLFSLSIYNRYLYETTNFKLKEANEKLSALTNCRVLSSTNIPSGGYYLFCEEKERKSPNAKQ